MRKNKKILIAVVTFIVLLVFLLFVFRGWLILPQSINIRGWQVKNYGLIIAAAAASAIFIARSRSKNLLSETDFETVTLVSVVSGFVGARVYHVLSQLDLYRNNLIDTLKIWNGGLSIYGALLFGLLSIVLLKKYFKPLRSITITQILDICTPAFLLGQIIGRFGNLFNYEAFGLPTHLPWKMFVPEALRPEKYLSFEYFHPVFLYEASANFIFLLLLFQIDKKKPKSGYLFFLYLFMYNSTRILLEFLRTDSVIHAGLRVNALISLLISVVSISIIFLYYRKPYETAHSQHS